ncbi:DUF6538 domain-containing protein [Jiella pelagia]|uniref:DUF6538 domain-containing protein n=1 Tax=Jiella pelagia TaxID=2986949 RepID=UPI0038B2B316
MASAANLRLKGSRFYFRRTIPYNLVERFGRSEIVRLLHISEHRKAIVRARAVWLWIQGVFEVVLQQPTLTREPRTTR